MTDKPRNNVGHEASPYDHDPLETRRVPPADQESGFLERLREQGVVVAVGDDGVSSTDDLPVEAEWIVYPNGDLERLRLR